MSAVGDWFSTRLAPPPEPAAPSLPDWASDLAPWQVAIDAAVAKLGREHAVQFSESAEQLSDLRRLLHDQEARVDAQDLKINGLLVAKGEDHHAERDSDLCRSLELQATKLREQEVEVREAAISRELAVQELDLRTQTRIEQVVLDRQAADKSMCDWLAERQDDNDKRFAHFEHLLEQGRRSNSWTPLDGGTPRKSKYHGNSDGARSPLKEIVSDLSSHLTAVNENSENIVLTTPRGDLMSLQDFIECLTTPRGDRGPSKELFSPSIQRRSRDESLRGFRDFDRKMLEMKASLQGRLEELDIQNRQELANQIAATREYILERLDSTMSAYHGGNRQRGRVWRMFRPGRAQQPWSQRQRRIKAD